MSRVRADRYTDRAGTGSPTFSEGVNVVGISSLGITTVTGVGQTALTVNGDARITGVLTVGQGSVTIDGTSGSSSITGVTTAGITSAYINSINNLNYPTAGPLSNRNIVVNGAMQVAQRGNTVSSINSGTGYYTADRFRLDVSMGTWTSDRMTNSQGDTYESGSTERFRNSLRLTCTTGQASPGATDNVKVVYFIEGQDVQHLDYGTTNAKTMTLSFWVKSSKTGTGTLELIQEDNSDRQFSASYTIYTANTWEQKVITIPADSSGLINNDSGRGLDIIWWLNSGSTFTGGSQGGWRAISNSNRNSDNLAIGSANDDEWFLTGVQLEIGERATPFEHRRYADEEFGCLRYYTRYGQTLASGDGTDDGFITMANYTNTAAYGGHTFNVPMRGRPTMRAAGCSYYSNGSVDSSINIDLIGATTLYGEFRVTAISFTGGHAGWVRIEQADAYVEFDAEL